MEIDYHYRNKLIDFLNLNLLKDLIFLNIIMGFFFVSFSEDYFLTLQPLYLIDINISKVSIASVQNIFKYAFINFDHYKIVLE